MKAIHEQKLNENFAKKNNLSIDEMNIRAQEVYDTLNEADFATDDARWARAYRRVRGAFRKKARSMANSESGMIVCRMSNKDFDRNQYDYAMRILLKDGKEQALAQGFVNKDGNPIYRFGDKTGQVILNDNNEPGRPGASGRAIGYTFKTDDEGNLTDVQSRYIIISKRKVDDHIPVCQIGNLSISVADDKQANFPYSDNNFAYYNDSSLSAINQPPYNTDEVNFILHQWNEAFGDNFTIVSNVNDLETFKNEHAYSKDHKENEYDFCVVAGIVGEIFPSQYGKYGNSSVTIEFVDYETLETDTLRMFVPEEMLQGLCMAEDDQGIFVLQVSKGKNDIVMWHLGGFLPVADDVDVEAFFGINMEE